MTNFALENILYFFLFILFFTAQNKHFWEFHGAFTKFKIVLSIYTSASLYTGLIFLIYYGFNTSWWSPIILLLISIIAVLILWQITQGIMKVFIRHYLPDIVPIISLIGLITLPLFAFLMFSTIPSSRNEASSMDGMFFLFGGLLFLSGVYVLVSAKEYKFRHLGLTLGGLTYLIGGILTINLLSWSILICTLAVLIIIKEIFGDDPLNSEENFC